jgi:methyl-accepting chemotaxis protein
MSQTQKRGGWSIFAPGVSLFRQMRFRAKAVLISLTFILPVLILGASYVGNKRSAVEVVQQELLGVRVAREVVPAFNHARRVRRATLLDVAGSIAADDLARMQAGLQQEIERVKQLDTTWGSQLGTHELVKRLDELHRTSAPASAGLFKVFASHTKVDLAIKDLIDTVADGSGLTLDPEIDTYYLQNAAFALMPSLLESSAKIRSLGSVVALSGKDGALITLELAHEEALLDFLSSQLKSNLAKVVQVHPEWKEQLDISATLTQLGRLRDVVGDNPAGAGVTVAQKIDQGGKEVVLQLEKVQQRCISLLNQLLLQREQELQRELSAVAVAVLLCLLAALYMFAAFYLVVNGGLQTVRHHLQQMSEGDLTQVLEVKGRDETVALMESMLHMQQSLVHLVTLLRSGADRLATSSNQVAAAAQDLAERTNETVSQLQGSAQATVEISTTVESTADNAQQASSLSRENADLASKGGQVIGELVHTMDEIRDSSSKIGDIIGVIDGIAFQTNILALNAAVEAARAGEAGRGFAVVAAEVRALAQRSAGAAREIKQLINISVDKVGLGNVTVKAAGSTIEQIVGSANRINDLLNDISVATREQTGGVKQVEQSIQELDTKARENARMVQDAAHAADALRELAHELVDEVGKFKINETEPTFF